MKNIVCLGLFLSLAFACHKHDSKKSPEAAPNLTGPGGVAFQPVSPSGTGNAGSALGFAWGLSLNAKPRTCSTIYDLRDTKNLALHILCPGDAGRTLSIQTERFDLVSDDGKQIVLKKTASTCNDASVNTTVSLPYTVSDSEASHTLVLSQNGNDSPAMKRLDPASLAGNLGQDATLYGRSVVRGCFKDGYLTRFEARTAAR